MRGEGGWERFSVFGHFCFLFPVWCFCMAAEAVFRFCSPYSAHVWFLGLYSVPFLGNWG